jgi:Ca2+-binding EF-hand superfamily protein
VIIVVTFDIYDFDGDGFISAADMTAVTAATLREHDIVIPRYCAVK